MVWWEKGFYEQEDEAVREIVAAFEDKTGKQVELVQPPNELLLDKVQAALAAGEPPDFLFPFYGEQSVAQWAHEGRLVDLADALKPYLALFDPVAIEASTFPNRTTGRAGLYALPMGLSSNHVHVWDELLSRAGFTLEQIPEDWSGFWSFWCDAVQPALRDALGRTDVWGVGLPMSADAVDTQIQLNQFQLAHASPWIDRGGRLQLDHPEIRSGMISALADYTSIWRKGCTPPGSTAWGDADNNKAFFAKSVAMTVNGTLSIPAALRAARPHEYRTAARTIDWPNGVDGRPLVIEAFAGRAVVFEEGSDPALALSFVRFLIEDGWLAHWLTFAGDRRMPPMRSLLEQPFWLDPNDPHRMRAAMQLLERPHQIIVGSGDDAWRSAKVWDDNVWGKAVERVAVDGLTPEQAVDEAIARIKEILAE